MIICSFQSVYPSLVANVHGKQFLQNLQKFKERQIRQQAIAQYQAMEASGFVDSTGQRDDIFRQLLPSIIRNHADAIPPAAYNFGPLGLLDTDQRTHPYILDWYYMCHSPHTDRAEASLHFDEESPEFFQNTSPPGRETSEIEEAENNYSEVYGRAESHMGASTSSTLFRHAPTKHHGKEDSSAGNWWGQAPAYPHDLQQDSFVEPPEFEKHNMATLGSFLEPPEFGNRNMARDSRSSHHSGDISEGSEGDLEQGDNRSTSSSSSWRNPQTLARTRYMDDSYMEEEGLDLHFADKDEDRRPGGADAYDRAPAGLPVRIIPRSSDPLPVDWQK
jgi:autophagy-related protein 9